MLKRLESIRNIKTDEELIEEMLNRGWKCRDEVKKCIDPDYRGKFIAKSWKLKIMKLNLKENKK